MDDPILPRWLTLKQATKYCPYGPAHLKKLILDKKIKGGKTTDKKLEWWFVDRESIDDYMEQMCGPENGAVKLEAKKIIDSLRRV